jgi:hypothetical protein
VIQTAGLVRNWQDIRKAYRFLKLTGVVAVPIISVLVLTAPFDIGAHADDLIAHYATILNGAALAAFTLAMTVNTAFVASSEMLERVAQRYRLTWLIATNRRDSLYRVHLMNATFFSGIILLTNGWPECLPSVWWPAFVLIWGACSFTVITWGPPRSSITPAVSALSFCGLS